jgi:transposase
MGEADAQAALFETTAEAADAIVINDRCVLRVEDDQRLVVAAGIPLAHFVAGDQMAAAYAMITLVEQGWADQNDVARAFGCSPRTLRRYQQRYDAGGLARLGHAVGYPKGHARTPARDRAVGRLKAAGLSNRAIAHRLGLDEKSVRKRLRRLGWTPRRAEQMPLAPPAARAAAADPTVSALPTNAGGPPLEAPSGASSADPNRSAFSAAPVGPPSPTAAAAPASATAPTPAEEFEPVPPSLDPDPADRRFDRLLAYMGLLNDAAPRFRAGQQVPGAGVLLALPSLIATGVFTAARQVYGSIGPAFYGLRTTLLTLLLMALLRIKRAEALKEHSPTDLGRLLGLDRAPEVKTLRRKLTRLARLGEAEHLGRLLAERRVALRGSALGFLYLDGHVRVYHGQRRLPKAHVARMRLALPATTDYWVNDQQGDPLFVVTAEANAGLVRTLPRLLSDVRALVGERRVTVVFDRGGWSPKLFAELVRQGFDLLTYRKGRVRRVPRRCFREHVGIFDGREVRYQLADQGVRLLKGRLRLRQVTRLKDDHQTPIVTSRQDLPAVEVAYRMFERWRQENFFKYLREEFLLDALVDYQIEPDDPAREVPNPAWAARDAKLREARGELARLQQRYGTAALANPEHRRPTMRGFKIAHGKLAHAIRAASRRVRDLERQRARLPRRIPVGQRTDEPVIKLATERKHLTDLLKMVAYQAESDLVRAVAPHYSRHEDEGRTLVQTALAAAADLEVTETELRVTLAPLSSAHRSRALMAVCPELNATETLFPGTRLRLHYAVGEPP